MNDYSDKIDILGADDDETVAVLTQPRNIFGRSQRYYRPEYRLLDPECSCFPPFLFLPPLLSF